MGKVMLVDGPNLLIRAVHATERAGMHSGGVNTGPLLVFVNTLSRHVREERPDRLAVCWDAGPSLRRTAMFPAYKAHRPVRSEEDEGRRDDAFAIARTFLSLSRIHHLTRHGQEADDLIAAYWHRHRGGDDVVILSSDKDFLQLADRGTEIVRLSSGGADTDRWDRERVAAEMGLEPQYVPLLMGLTGDVSDGVPGVRGIGPKKGLAILTECDFEWDRVLRHPKVAPHWEAADLSRDLVDLRRLPDVPVNRAPHWAPTGAGDSLWEPLNEFLMSYEMSSVISRLHNYTLWQ